MEHLMLADPHPAVEGSQQMGGGRGCTSATFLQVQGASSLESFEVRWQGQPTVPQSSYYIMSMKLLPAKPMCSHQQDTCNFLIWFGTRLSPILQARRFRKELSFTCGQVSSRAVSESGPMAQRQRSGLGRAVLPLSGLCCGMEGEAEVTMAAPDAGGPEVRRMPLTSVLLSLMCTLDVSAPQLWTEKTLAKTRPGSTAAYETPTFLLREFPALWEDSDFCHLNPLTLLIIYLSFSNFLGQLWSRPTPYS
ncbi:hypothetical protein PAL_GLEAN10011381 [Pteropus alecto]|uniref:Uncharacterized protein n=1 Tax=Pteropus alecto TaxID=9402 RepID=L5KRE4_PTEAL|nr:hypothetical protein PAL_GLEAN10011381 [Pteropus alecto]